MNSVQIKKKNLGIRWMPSSWNLDFRQRFWLSVKKSCHFSWSQKLLIVTSFFSNVYCFYYSIYACIHWVFFFWLKYANELCILPKRPDCNFKQTIVNINYARGWEKCLKSFLKTIHSTIIKILPYSWLIIL